MTKKEMPKIGTSVVAWCGVRGGHVPASTLMSVAAKNSFEQEGLRSTAVLYAGL